MRGPCSSIARYTISMALSTPAQKPLGLAKYIFKIYQLILKKLTLRSAGLRAIEKFCFLILHDEQSYQ